MVLHARELPFYFNMKLTLKEWLKYDSSNYFLLATLAVSTLLLILEIYFIFFLIQMAILTDDCDIREVYLQTMVGGNGDYYINLYEYPSNRGDQYHSISYRMSMSGGQTGRSIEVRIAMANLFRAMEAEGLNEFPENK